jgi:hypothetical protein
MFNYEDLLSNQLYDKFNTEIEEGECKSSEIHLNHNQTDESNNKKTKKKQKKKAKKKTLTDIEDNNLISLVSSQENSKICIIDNHLSSHLYVSKLKMVHFDTNEDLFRKGRMDFISDSRAIEIPELKFWHNRYYYFSRFDEGITMDFESNKHLN